MFTWGDVKKEIAAKGLTLEDSDILVCGLEEGYEYHNSSDETSYQPDSYRVSIVRYADETDEQFERRVTSREKAQAMIKKVRYQDYLKLKQEFEPETTTVGDQR
jgi:hypothetical protein